MSLVSAGGGVSFAVVRRMQEAIFKLNDRRSLSYAVYGKEVHRPVLYFHGTPSSRMEPLLVNHYGLDLEQALARAGLRLIAIDRPGMGFSSFNPRGDFLSFAHDARQLCEHLGISSCPVLCWSGGGPYTLAMAYQFPYLISSAHIITGFTRKFDREISSQMGMNRWYFYLARTTPWLLRSSMNLISQRKTKGSLPRKITGLPMEDYRLLEKPGQLEAISSLTLKQAVRLGARGAVYEARNYYRDFGFELKDIIQPVHYWWGTKDMTVIRLHPEKIETEAPRAVMHYREGEGHLSIYIHCFYEILEQVARSC